MSKSYNPPFPWFGGKSKIANVVWQRFGQVPNYVEPFAGSAAVLFKRPKWTFTNDFGRETINDYDGHVANFWRACKYDPNGVAAGADRIIHELDLHAVGNALFCRPSKTWNMEPTEWIDWLRADEKHFDAERAGQWCWFVANWIGGLPSVNNSQHQNDNGVLHQKRPHLSGAGQGVSRKQSHNELVVWMKQIRDRLRNVRVCCGDWSRVCGKVVTWSNAVPCAVFLDPPYSIEAGRDNNLYSEECGQLAHDVREWAIEQGKRSDMRIIVCGYEDEHTFPDDWKIIKWKTQGGMSHIGKGTSKGIQNSKRERLWCSPACLKSGIPSFGLFE